MRRFALGLVLGCISMVGCASQRATTPSPVAPAAAPVAQVAVDPGILGLEASPAPDDQPPTRDGRWISAATASDYMLIGEREQMFGVWIDVPSGAARGHVPTSLTLAIDTSGSMRGDKIVHAREAARRLVEEMEPGDLISIVSFSDRARVMVSPTVLDEPSRRQILNVIEELHAQGGTAMHQGLKVAESQMWGTPDTHLVRRLVVISDGKATVGPTSPHALGQVAEVGLQRGIQVTSVGVGLDYDESTLNALAIRSSGRLHHVEHSAQLPGIVEREVALLESTAAADVEVELVAAPGVRILGTDTAHNRWGQEGLIVPIGAMFEGQQRELLVRARVDDSAEGTKVLASVRLHYRDPTEDGLRRVQEAILRATVTDDPSLVAAHTHSRMQVLMAMREASSFTQLASQQANLGDFDRADLELARAEAKIHDQVRHAKNKADRDRMSRSAASISATRKKLKKAKRAPAKAKRKAGREAALDLNAEAMEVNGF